MFSWFESTALWLEARFGRAAAVCAALGLLVAASLYVRPAVQTVALGNLYARMAGDPFTLIDGSYVGFRILAPLLSWLLGFRGQLIIVFNLLTAFVLLVLVYVYFRRRSPNPVDALFATAVVAFSLVTLTTIYYGGYTDSLTYLIVFLMWWARKKPVAFYFLFMLGMLNRECMLFLMPWFFFLRWESRASFWKTAVEAGVGFALALVPYYFVRQWIAAQGEVPFRAMYYLQPLLENPFYWLLKSYPHSGLGLFTVFKLLWVIPLVAAVGLWRDGERREVYSMAILLAGTSAQLILAFDSSRMLTLCFPVVLIGLVYLFRTNAFSFRGWAVPLLLGNLLVPQLYTAGHTVEIMSSVPGNLLLMILGVKDGW
jgi:hypothetical protein